MAFVVTFRQISEAPFWSLAVTLIVDDAKLAGRLEESWEIILTVLGPFATGHVMPSQVRVPTLMPSSEILKVLGSQISPLNVFVRKPALITISKEPPVTVSSTEPTPIISVFWPSVMVPGVSEVVLPWVFPSPQSFQVSFRVDASSVASVLTHGALIFWMRSRMFPLITENRRVAANIVAKEERARKV